ncbi:MAG: hypothetical protein L0Z50_26110, partial [Verrucomicrobiales bacterium]|nr:hypothetical protein [Verrucomicrobiales bacterium]
APDGKTLVTASFDQSVRLWDVRTGKQLRIIQQNMGAVRATAFSPDGKRLATGADQAIVWDTTSWNQLASKAGRVTGLAFAPGNGKTLALARSGGVMLWKIEE